MLEEGLVSGRKGPCCCWEPVYGSLGGEGLASFSRRYRCNGYPPGIICSALPVMVPFSVRADWCQALAGVSAGCSCWFFEIDGPGPSAGDRESAEPRGAVLWRGSPFRSPRGPGRPIRARQCVSDSAPPQRTRCLPLSQTSLWTRMATSGSGTEAGSSRRDGIFINQGPAGRLAELGTRDLREQALGSL